MGFKKVNCKAEIDAELKKNPEMIKLAEEFDREYELMKKIVKVRKEMGLTQKDISEKSGLTQQMVSRIENVGHSPTLSNFMKYLTAIGLNIDIVRKVKM